MNKNVMRMFLENLLAEAGAWDTQNRRGARVYANRPQPQAQPQQLEAVPPQQPVLVAPPQPPVRSVMTAPAPVQPQPVAPAPVAPVAPAPAPPVAQPIQSRVPVAQPAQSAPVAVQAPPQPTAQPPAPQPQGGQSAAMAMGNKMAETNPTIPKTDGTASGALTQQTAINKQASKVTKTASATKPQKHPGSRTVKNAGTAAGAVGGAAVGTGAVALALRNKINTSKNKIQTLQTQLSTESNPARKKAVQAELDKANAAHKTLMRKYRMAQGAAGVAGGAAGAYAGRKAATSLSKNFSGSKVLAGIKSSLNKAKR